MGEPCKVAILVGVFGAFLSGAIPVAAATLNDQTSIFNSEFYDLPSADLAGWLLTFDPSAQWTTASNIVTMESWMAVVADIVANPWILDQLAAGRFSGIGLTDSPPPAIWQWVGSGELPQAPQQDLVPEPATLGLLGGSLLILGFYLAIRARRRNKNSTHVSIRSTNRSRDYQLHPQEHRSRTRIPAALA